MTNSVLLLLLTGSSIRGIVRSGWARQTFPKKRIVCLIPSEFVAHYTSDPCFSDVCVIGFDESEIRKSHLESLTGRVIKRIFYYANCSTEKNPACDAHWVIYKDEVLKHGVKGFFKILVIASLARLCGLSSFVRSILRLIDQACATPTKVLSVLTDISPDLLVTGSFGNLGIGLDGSFLKAAKKVGIPTSVFVVGWDNPTTKGVVNVYPDRVYSWGPRMSEDLIEFAGLDRADLIEEVGPQVFNFAREIRGKLMCSPATEKLPDHKHFEIFLFLKSPNLYSGNIELIEQISSVLEQNRSSPTHARDWRLIVRPHPNLYRSSSEGVWEHSLERERMVELVETYSPRIHLLDHVPNGCMPTDLDKPEQTALYTSLDRCDLVICSYSTALVEAAMFDKPIINFDFDADNGLNRWKRRQGVHWDREFIHNVRALNYEFYSQAGSAEELGNMVLVHLNSKQNKTCSSLFLSEEIGIVE